MPARDEELREALLEVQILRQREARALRESNALLQVMEAVTAAPSPADAVIALLRAVAQISGASGVAIAQAGPGGLILRHALPSEWVGFTFTAPTNLANKARNLADLSRLPAWQAALPTDMAALRSMASLPLPGEDPTHPILICLHPDPAAFDAHDMVLLRRVAQLAGQALRAAALSAERDLLSAAIAGSPAGFAIADATQHDNPLIYVNPAFERITGFSRDEVLGLNCRILSAEKPDAPERTRLRATVRNQAEGRFLVRNRRKSGALFWNELSLFPVHEADGAVRYMVATQTDASETVAARADRDQSQRRLEDALANTADAFLLLDADRSVAFANDQVAELFPAPGLDWRPGTGLDENWAAVLRGYSAGTPLSDAQRRADLSDLMARSNGAELTLPDGRVALLRARGLADGGLVISATDVSPLKTAETMLRQRAVAIESAQDGIAIADGQGGLIYLNSSFAHMMRRRLGGPLLGTDWLSHYMPDDRARHGPRIMAALAERGQAKAVLRRLRRDETLVYHELTLSRVDDVGTVIVARDVTDRIVQSRERARMTAELERARQQEAISQLAAGIAHDFNNLLSAINGSAQLIVLDAAASADIRVHADRITAAGNRAARMVNRLLDLGAGRPDQQLFDLRDTLAEAVELIQPSLRDGIALDMALPEHGLMVQASPTELVQVAVNLLLNAQDSFADDAGRITLDLRCVSPATEPPPTIGQLDADRRYARLRVTDTGSGIPNDRQREIFKPYFSTKGDKGTGMGLAMTARIVSDAGGAIGVQSRPGRGTTFDIFLPCRGTPQDLVPPGTELAQIPETARAALRGAAILIVDDDPRVGEVLGTYLEQQGAEVSVTQDPELARDALQEDPMAWAALITDYDMPGLDGGALITAARQAREDLPVFLVTALARRLNDPRVTAAGIKGVFAKPVDLRHLALAVASSLGSGTDATTGHDSGADE